MATIRVRDGENIESALRRFKKKVDAEGIIQEYRKRMYFQKPSVVKRAKLKESIRKSKIKEKKDQKEFKKERNPRRR